jgi:uncharacterized protein
MRKKEREIKDPQTVEALLYRTRVGRFAAVNGDGFPVIKPVNFLFRDGKIYFHSSMEGEKAAAIRGENRVCFEIDQPISYKAAGQPCAASYYYRSVIAKGTAVFVDDPHRKIEILKQLVDKYEPGAGDGRMPDHILRQTAVVEIRIEEMTGKELMG